MAGTVVGEVEYVERGTATAPERIVTTKPREPIPTLKLRIRDSSGKPTQILFRGDVPGHVDIGDQVRAEGRLEGGLLRAESIFNETTKSWVTPKLCFIATAAAGPNSPEVKILRRFRDDVLSRFRFGRHLVILYESVAPPLATVIKSRPKLRYAVRAIVLKPTAAIIGRLLKNG